MVSVPRAAITHYHMLEGLKPQKFIFLQVLEPEVHKQGVAIAIPLP